MKKFFKGLGSGLLYFAIYFGVQLAVSFAATFLFMFIAMADVNVGAFYNEPTVMENVLTKVMEMTYEHAMLLTLISNVVLIPILWLIFVFRKKKFFSEIEYKSINPLFIPVIAVAGCALNVVVALVMGYLPIPEEIMESYNEMASMIGDGNPIVSFISAGLIAPVVEEIVFRGLIFTRFKKGMPVWVASVLS